MRNSDRCLYNRTHSDSNCNLSCRTHLSNVILRVSVCWTHGHGNAVVLSGQGDKDKISYCQDCLKVKILSPLRHRIYLDDDGKIANPAPDADKWKQCWTCGVIVGVYEASPEVELDTLTEPRDNPFKFKSGRVRTGESRKFDRSGKTQRKRKLKHDLEHYKEEDVKEALRKGSKLISYHES